jgi:hypothetical protein
VATHSAGRVLGGEASVETEEDLAVATLAVATRAVATPAAETEIPEAIANAR